MLSVGFFTQAVCVRRLALFQAVNTLSVFVGSNQGDAEVTRISKIVISGTTLQGMNVNEIKKSDED